MLPRNAARSPVPRPIAYDKVCFVIMPFGRRTVGGREVDFDFIYQHVFKPAIEAVALPEGGNLEPRRTDKDFFAGDISQEMFEYIEYSRFAIADISGLNANVFYELGVRHRAHESGTAIFRQEAGPPPFDIGQIKAFPYEYEPSAKVAESVELVRRVLTESLAYNRLDSPPMRALRAQFDAERGPRCPNVEPLLVEADNALRVQAWAVAIRKFSEAIEASGHDTMILMKRGLVYRDQGMFDEARHDFDAAIGLSPGYAEAYRERGIAENKLFMKELKARKLAPTPENLRALESDLPSGEASLRKAVELNSADFDAHSSLGGVLKRQGRLREALKAYAKAISISQGNSYPLLNALTLKAYLERRLRFEGEYVIMLEKALRALKVQADAGFNPPWSTFDLAQVHLFLGNDGEFTRYVDQGILECKHKSQAQTFRETLELLAAAGLSPPGLDRGLVALRRADRLPG